MGENDHQACIANLTEFMYEITMHCYILNTEAVGLRVSEDFFLKVFPI